VAVKIKLKRLGRTRVPTYRIVVADARTKRDGRAIEEIGKYHPKEEPSLIEVNSERAQHWLSVGAQPTPPVMNILKITGDWQKFKGEPGAEGTLRVREPRADKREVFADALKSAGKDSSSDSGATTPKGGGRTRKADSKASDGKASDSKASDSKAKADTEAKADASPETKTETKAAKPESGRSKSKASAEKTAAGSADDSAAAAATASDDTASADTASADTASADTASAEPASAAASESSEPGSEA
jgi:small subunit ribosomal protein S16